MTGSILLLVDLVLIFFVAACFSRTAKSAGRSGVVWIVIGILSFFVLAFGVGVALLPLMHFEVAWVVSRAVGVSGSLLLMKFAISGRKKGADGPESDIAVIDRLKLSSNEPVAIESTTASALVSVRNLHTWFPIRRGVLSRTVGHVKAVDGVSFDIAPGKTLGLVGESGCGKTTAGRTILRLIPATGGTVRYKGEDFFAYQGNALRKLRRQMQIVFQDPVSSLNPRMTIGNIIGEPIEVHDIAHGSAKNDLVASLLRRVGLDPSYGRRYPHEFSGGQRQRIGIARALSLSPDFIVCDEPVSALDVSIQSQILNLLDDLQQERGIAYLFIAHNLAVVEHFSDEVAVMYLGRIVEKAPSKELYQNPRHPYTVALLSAIPVPDPRPRKRRIMLPGEVPSPSNPPSGCPFHPRCPLTRQKAAESSGSQVVQVNYRGGSLPAAPGANGDAVAIESGGQAARVMRKCVEEIPSLQQKHGQPGHIAACWYTE